MQNPQQTPAHNSRIDIRDLTEADFESLRALYAKSLSRNNKGFIQATTDRPLRDIGDICCSFQDNNGAMHGLYVDDDLVGFGGLCRHNDDTRVELCKLHLNENYQGRGLGRKLLESLINEADTKGYEIIELHVTATQVAALGLYVRMGFMQTERKMFVADNGEEFDTIYMERAVKMKID